ncbi:hypothetical protein JKP88DRAFT_243012 [Tribonema minus]|uniref:Calcium uniporter protein C-terminal domain-containing protein n=1 Tax=Tribonema minus TaxID=303371 RepID=A0A835ZDG9_9STRA|nr:hypothetical protein JKP88DRAFT_243012 [Tribonema minus]
MACMHTLRAMRLSSSAFRSAARTFSAATASNVTIKRVVAQGAMTMSLPLPGKPGLTAVSTPLHHTVRDLLDNLKEIDPSLPKAEITNGDGQRIAASTALAALLDTDLYVDVGAARVRVKGRRAGDDGESSVIDEAKYDALVQHVLTYGRPTMCVDAYKAFCRQDRCHTTTMLPTARAHCARALLRCAMGSCQRLLTCPRMRRRHRCRRPHRCRHCLHRLRRRRCRRRRRPLTCPLMRRRRRRRRRCRRARAQLGADKHMSERWLEVLAADGLAAVIRGAKGATLLLSPGGDVNFKRNIADVLRRDDELLQGKIYALEEQLKEAEEKEKAMADLRETIWQPDRSKRRRRVRALDAWPLGSGVERTRARSAFRPLRWCRAAPLLPASRALIARVRAGCRRPRRTLIKQRCALAAAPQDRTAGPIPDPRSQPHSAQLQSTRHATPPVTAPLGLTCAISVPLPPPPPQLARARRGARIKSAGVLGFLTLQFSGLFYLVYEVYSWDIMEPASYFLMLSYSVGSALYFSFKKREATFDNLLQLAIAKHQRQLEPEHGYSVAAHDAAALHVARIRRARDVLCARAGGKPLF